MRDLRALVERVENSPVTYAGQRIVEGRNVEELLRAVRRLAEALEKVASEHLVYPETGGQYGIGLADGHRCAAGAAAEALAAVGWRKDGR